MIGNEGCGRERDASFCKVHGGEDAWLMGTLVTDCRFVTG